MSTSCTMFCGESLDQLRAWRVLEVAEIATLEGKKPNKSVRVRLADRQAFLADLDRAIACKAGPRPRRLTKSVD
jgi:hypothetical protein